MGCTLYQDIVHYMLPIHRQLYSICPTKLSLFVPIHYHHGDANLHSLYRFSPIGRTVTYILEVCKYKSRCNLQISIITPREWRFQRLAMCVVSLWIGMLISTGILIAYIQHERTLLTRGFTNAKVPSYNSWKRSRVAALTWLYWTESCGISYCR